MAYLLEGTRRRAPNASLALTQTMGAFASEGVDALFGNGARAGLVPTIPASGSVRAASRQSSATA